MAEKRVTQCRLTPAAASDLDQIFDYTVQRWGAKQAVRYTDEMESVCAALAAGPALGKDCSHIREGYRRAICGQHFIYYRAELYGIAIIRVLHQRMDALPHL